MKSILKRIIIRIFNRLISVYWSEMYEQYRKKYSIDPSFRFNGKNILFYEDGDIYCGAGSYIGGNSSIGAIRGYKVKIGRNCAISHYVHIYTSNYYADQDFTEIDKKQKNGDVLIGDYCWIGIKASIMGPVTIGDNSVIGANSLVNRDLPPHSISMGVPARVVKFKSYLSEEEKTRLTKNYRDVLCDRLKQLY